MRKAKENVERHYAVVGVLEELNKTLTVLEHYVPRFFKGALDTYWSKYFSYNTFFVFIDTFSLLREDTGLFIKLVHIDILKTASNNTYNHAQMSRV